MLTVDNTQTYTAEEYFKLEETSECKHDYYFGKLFAMPGAPILHNKMCLKLFVYFFSQLSKKGFQVLVENVKVKIENEQVYVYPDILITREEFHSMNDYVVYSPILLVEVLSDATRKYDSTDKFIQYQKISSLRYYLLVEPEKHVVLFYEKDESGEWTAKTYTELSEIISLPVLETQLLLETIYQ